MSDRSEHLIERAAAKLRAANAAQLSDQSSTAPAPVQDKPIPVPLPRAADLADPVIPDRVAGPIPTPAPPLTRPVIMPVAPPLTISPGALSPAAYNGGQTQSVPPYSGQADTSAPLAYQGQATDAAGLARSSAKPIQTPAAPPEPKPAATPRPAQPNYGVRAPGLTSLGFDLTPSMSSLSGASLGSTLALQPPPIVQLDALERAGMVVARTTRTRISEEYRIAIGRILRVLHETTDIQGARNVLMVTSARPGEGKSFTALNLAGSIAQNGTDAVLLVDVDPKVKPLSDQLGLGEVQGFLDLVSDPSLRPEDLLRVTAIPNLAVMPVGTRLGGAAQTIGGTASMRPIIPTITRLARRFPKHLIMLDAPPCLSTSDPHTLAPHVGQVVLVVEAERTQRSEVEAAVDLVRVCPSITLLLNKVRMTTSHTFGAYDYFGSYT